MFYKIARVCALGLLSVLLMGCAAMNQEANPPELSMGNNKIPPVQANAEARPKSYAESLPNRGFAEHIPAPGKRTFIFDPKLTSWAVYDSSGDLVRTGAASGGANWSPDVHRRTHTPSGSYHVYAKRGPECKSSKFPLGKGGAPTAYCMFFKGGYAIHASGDVPPDRNASHGCIRVHYQDAKWLNTEFLGVGSKVIVRSY